MLFVLLFLIVKGFGWVTTPAINPYSQRKLVLTGVFFYEQGYELRFAQRVHSTNKYINWLNGLPVALETGHIVPRSIDSPGFDVPVTRVGCCNYEVTLFYDYILPGIAGWQNDGYTAYFLKYDKNGRLKTANKHEKIFRTEYIAAYRGKARNIYCGPLYKNDSLVRESIYHPELGQYKLDFVKPDTDLVFCSQENAFKSDDTIGGVINFIWYPELAFSSENPKH